MTKSFQNPSSISIKAKELWRKRLYKSQTCTSGFLDACSFWDAGYNSSDHEPLNSQRETDLANYFIWIDEFARHLDINTEEALCGLYKTGLSLPSLGRLIYKYLQTESIRPFLVVQHNNEILRSSSEFPDNLIKAEGRRQRNHGSRLMNSMTLGLVQYMKLDCGHPHYAHLAQLLNHGSSFPIHLTGGVFGAYRFHLIEIEYSESMLRSRARRANPEAAFDSILNELSIESQRDLLASLESKTSWRIALQAARRLFPEMVRLL